MHACAIPPADMACHYRVEQLRLQKQREQQEYYRDIAAQIEAKKLQKAKEVSIGFCVERESYID